MDSDAFDRDHFDLFHWHMHMLSCTRYFVNVAQYTGGVQALAHFLNIKLPFQWRNDPVYSMDTDFAPPHHQATQAQAQAQAHHQASRFLETRATPASPSSPPPAPPAAEEGAGLASQPTTPVISLVPYIRRLVVTGFDADAVLHGFFGDHYAPALRPLQECERANYLFAAKSDSWLAVKAHYDMAEDGQTVPFLRPLGYGQYGGYPSTATTGEPTTSAHTDTNTPNTNTSTGTADAERLDRAVRKAEEAWSAWLAMQDWMVGSRAP